MATNSRLRFGSNGSATSPSKVPLARISELYDDDFSIPDGDTNHNVNKMSRPSSKPASRAPPLAATKNGKKSLLNQEANDTSLPEPHRAMNNFTQPSAQGRADPGGCNPIIPNCFAYFGAAVLFLIGMNVSGLSLLTYPWIGNLLWYEYQLLSFPDGVVLLQFLWCGHFIRRFAENLFVHIFRRKMPFFESVGAQVYYCFFGFWIGWSINFKLGYRIPTYCFFIPGGICFLIGEVGNFYSHLLLRRLRLQPSGQTALSSRKRIIAHGFLFDYITYPHYFFEIITWIGFYLMSHTMAVGVFIACSSITLIIRAVKGHNLQKKEFNGVDGTPLYPSKRKAIIPLIL